MKCQTCKKIPTFQITSHADYCMHTHYHHHIIENFEDIKDIFPEGKADDLNWFFVGTSGVHGTYKNLTDIEKGWEIDDETSDDFVGRDLTVLVVQPRVVTMKYGEIKVQNKEQLEFLKGLVKSTVEEINKRKI